MKKTLVALAVAAVAATSANAAVVYEQNGSKVEVNGSVGVLVAKVGKGKRADLYNHDSEVVFKGTQDLGNGLSALGAVQFRLDNNFGNPVTRDAYAGLSQEGVGTLTFGQQDGNVDAVQLGDYAQTWGGNNNLFISTSLNTAKDEVVSAGQRSDRVVKFKSADFNGFSFGLDYAFGNADKNQPAQRAYGAALFYTQQLDQNVALNLNAGYARVSNLWGDDSGSLNSYRLAAEIVSGPFAVAYNYGESKFTGDSEKSKFHLLGAKYAVNDLATVYGQFKRSDIDFDYLDADSAVNKYILGASYKLHSNVTTYAQYMHTKAGDVKDNAVGAGLRVFF